MVQRLILILAMALGTALAAADVAATMLKAQGKGQVFQPGGAEADYKAGALLRPGSRIVTGESGLAQLMDDGSRVSVGPNTDLTLAESKRDGGERSTVFQLVRGLFRATVQKLTVGSRFEVRTDNAVAAVKGTDFEVVVDDAGTEARVSEGTVWLENARGERAVLRQRMAARAAKGGRLAPARQLSEQELRNFGDWARESVAPRSGALLPADQAKRAAWARLRPDQKARVWGDLRDSLGDTWDDIVGLKAEERQERWRDRLRANDERGLAAEGARVDFALGKTALDRQGRRVRFDEFLVRPAADQIQFLNYTRRDERLDLISSINTYNRDLPRNLAEAPGLNQRVWLQGHSAPPRFWIIDSALVAANSSGDSFSANNSFYDPYFRPVLGYWELPVRDFEVYLNVPDLRSPRNGLLVERWVRQSGALPSPVGATGEPLAYQTTATVGKHVPGTTRNLTDINSNLAWGMNGNLPDTALLTRDGLEAQPGDLAFGFQRRYADGSTLEFRNYVINENGEIVNLAGIDPDKLMEAFVNRGLIASLKQIEIRSNRFNEADGINVVSKLLFLHDLFKNRDEL
jgi:hypothetical protein